jgi:hypothetical protein
MLRLEQWLHDYPAGWVQAVGSASSAHVALYRLRILALSPLLLCILWLAVLCAGGFEPTRLGFFTSNVGLAAMLAATSVISYLHSYAHVSKVSLLCSLVVMGELALLPLSAVTFASTCGRNLLDETPLCRTLTLELALQGISAMNAALVCSVVRRVEAGLMLEQLQPGATKMCESPRTRQTAGALLGISAPRARVMEGDAASVVVLQGVLIRVHVPPEI